MSDDVISGRVLCSVGDGIYGNLWSRSLGLWASFGENHEYLIGRILKVTLTALSCQHA